jgi:TPR repeat protein
MFRAPRHPKTIFSRFLIVLGMSVAHVVGGANIVRAAPLDLEFVPPQIEPTRICVPRPPDAQTVALWGNWDGVRLPAVSAAIVSRDINRLKQLDATRWLPTIEQMIARLEESEPRFAGTNALMARISAMEAAGEFEALNSQQLVAQLAADIETLSPRLKNEVSQYYRDGIGVPLDIEFANSLLIDAAYGGNADALLSLAKMELDGEGLDAWDVPTDLAVTMAFGALVGELDPYICDRATRIAREYISGEIVVQNAQLSHDWFRFAADLGDSNSAWKVVEFHSQAEAFEKDNDLLVRYLTQAADAQISYAQIELARLYEAGSLVDRNLDTALSLYRAAATSGLRPGLTRIMIFLEEHAERYPNLQEERLAALQQLSELDDVSGWVFTRLAEESYLRQGRWAGRADAMAYLERAAELDDLDGSVELAMGLIAQRNSPETFERAVDILSRSVTTLGGVRPTRLLYGAFMCSALDSPRLQEAQYWNATEDATATLNVEISASRLYDLSAQTDPLLIARLQSQALYGRSRSMANYLKYLEVNPAIPPETLAFWQEYSNQFSDVLTATAKLELELAQSPQQRVLAIDLLRQEYVSSGGSAALLLAEALLNFTTDVDFKREEVRNLLIRSASLGQGKAMSLLTTLEGGNNGAEEIYLQFADVIEANGDFDAILFAIPYVDAEVRDDYLSRAAGIISCDYKNVITLSRLLNDINDKNGALHWLEIAGQLIDNNAWAMTDLARSRLDIVGPLAAPDALELFETAAAMGNDTATTGTFELLVAIDLPTYAPDRAAEMISQAVDQQNAKILNLLLGRYRRADPSAKAVIDNMLDMPSIYLVAAQSGDVFSMRAYAVHLRDTATGGDDLNTSTAWFERAAQGGDVTAMAEYGYALAFGIGTDANLDAAVIWLEQAADAGSAKAASITSLLNLNEDT